VSTIASDPAGVAQPPLPRPAPGRTVSPYLRENARRPVSRVLSAPPWAESPETTRDDHSSGTRLTARLTRPTRTAGRECPRNCQLRQMQPPLFGLAPGGVYPAASVTGGAGRSYRPVSPLPAECFHRAGGLFSVALSLGSPPPAVNRHRIPVEPGLSSIISRQQRSSGRLAEGTWDGGGAPVKAGTSRA
jgi:hypothetical protein